MAEPPIKRKRVRRGNKQTRRTEEQLFVKARKAKRERTLLRDKMIREHPDSVVIGAVDGRVLLRREVTGKCRRCSNDFSFTMTTRPLRYCPGCREIVAEEKRLVARNRPKRPKPKPWPKGPRLIRYAGYDKSEKVQEKNYAKVED